MPSRWRRRTTDTPDVLTSRNAASIGAGLATKSNGLGALRLLLAVAVLVDHSVPLGGFGSEPGTGLTRSQVSLGYLAVLAFFAISGYLIAVSGLRGDVLQFMWRRILRIFPAYLTVLVVTAFAVGPAMWLHEHRPLGAYFQLRGNGPITFVTHNWTLHIHQWGIGDLLGSSTPWGRFEQQSIMNGSIWTLIYEWRCYLLIAALLASGALAKARPVVPIIAAAAGVGVLLNVVSPNSPAKIAPWLGDPYTVQFSFAFMLGATLAMYRYKIPLDWRLGVGSGFAALITLHEGGFLVLGLLPFTYFLLWVGATLPTAIAAIGWRNDYSYGTYVWGFLIQQLLADAGVPRRGLLVFTAVSIGLTVLVAIASWHLIEKPALALKDWGPGAGYREMRSQLRSGRLKRVIAPSTNGQVRTTTDELVNS